MADSPNRTHPASDVELYGENRQGKLESSVATHIQSYDRDHFESLLHQISHALQEPVRAICGFGSILQSRSFSDLDADAREYLSFMIRGAQQIEYSMQGWLRMARVMTRARPPQTVELRTCLDSAMATIMRSHDISKTEFEIGTLDSVVAPPHQVVDLLRELLLNALSAVHSEANPRIEIQSEVNGDRCVVEIQDNGCGLDPATLPRLDRVAPRQEDDGVGFGLCVCDLIVSRLGGTLEIESEPGKGALVRFDLPAACE